MNERKLRIFYEVAVRLNMTEVANSMYMSQPAVSQTIQDIENETGVKLFDRIGKRLYLTSEGEVFLSYVRRILNIYDEGIRTVKDMAELNTGKLRIGASTTIGIYLLPDIIGEFIKEYKGIDVSIAIENTKIIVDMINDNKIDFAFIEGPAYSDEIITEDFCMDELIFIAPENHPWCSKDFITPEDISREKIIMREVGSGTREVFENSLRIEGISYEIAFELGNTEAIKKAVEAGLGVSCISKRCILREIDSNKLCSIGLKGKSINRSFNLIYHRDKFLSKLHRTFIEFSRKRAN